MPGPRPPPPARGGAPTGIGAPVARAWTGRSTVAAEAATTGREAPLARLAVPTGSYSDRWSGAGINRVAAASAGPAIPAGAAGTQRHRPVVTGCRHCAGLRASVRGGRPGTGRPNRDLRGQSGELIGQVGQLALEFLDPQAGLIGPGAERRSLARLREEQQHQKGQTNQRGEADVGSDGGDEVVDREAERDGDHVRAQSTWGGG